MLQLMASLLRSRRILINKRPEQTAEPTRNDFTAGSLVSLSCVSNEHGDGRMEGRRLPARCTAQVPHHTIPALPYIEGLHTKITDPTLRGFTHSVLAHVQPTGIRQTPSSSTEIHGIPLPHAQSVYASRQSIPCNCASAFSCRRQATRAAPPLRAVQHL